MRAGQHARCGYYWTSKDCPECGEKNDIAARYCTSCKAEIIDPNSRLVLEYQKMKADPYIPTVDKILNASLTPWVSAKGKKTIKVTFTTDCRTFTAWFAPHLKGWSAFCDAFFGKKIEEIEVAYVESWKKPATITAAKIHGENFFKVYAFNQELDGE
jgi:DNA repair protein RadD